MARRIVILGGSGAIGSATARILRSRGDVVHLVGRDELKVRKLSEELDASVTIGDVTDSAMFARVADDLGAGPVDGVVYAVGTINLKSLSRLTTDDFIRDFTINAMGAASAVQSLLPAMKKAEQGCWAVLVTFVTTLPLDYDGLFIDGGPLSWAARNSSKPGRPSGESWVLHATPEWSLTNIERDKDAVQQEMLDAFFAATSAPTNGRPAVAFAQSHRWRYAVAENPLSVGYLWDASLRVGVCGDWSNSSRVEGAFLSGSLLANHIVQSPQTWMP